MKVLVIGQGGREHALVWKLARSESVSEVFCIPGNAGIAADATCVDLDIGDIPALVSFAKDTSIALTVVGPAAPLVAEFMTHANALLEDRARKRAAEFSWERPARELYGEA